MGATLHPNALPCKWGRFICTLHSNLETLWLPHCHRTQTRRFPQTHSGCKTSVRLGGYEFPLRFHFYSPFSSFPHPSCSFSLFLPYCFSLSLCFILFLIQAPCLSSSFTLSHRALCLLPQASCVYISVVYFYKCQTVFLPSVYWSTERRGDKERGRRMEGWGNANTKEGWDRKEEGERRLKSRGNVGMWFDLHPLLSFFIPHISPNSISCLPS